MSWTVDRASSGAATDSRTVVPSLAAMFEAALETTPLVTFESVVSNDEGVNDDND